MRCTNTSTSLNSNVTVVTLIPALNAASTIGEVVAAAQLHSNRVLVVDDGSADKTGINAKDAGAVVLRLNSNQGYGAALRAGLRELLSERAITVTLDADGVHDPTIIPAMVRVHYQRGHDLTIGSRLLGVGNLPGPKRAANHFATALINQTLGLCVTDAATGLRVLTPQVAKLGATLPNSDFSFTYALLAAVAARNLLIGEYPLEVRYPTDELWCTKQGELHDLLQFALINGNTTPHLEMALKDLLILTETFEDVSVHLMGYTFNLYGLRERESYVFQMEPRATQPPSKKLRHIFLFS